MSNQSITASASIPIINIAPLIDGAVERQAVAAAIGGACRESGFFYISGHGVSTALQGRLEVLSRVFFAQPVEAKLRIAMAHGGRAWRGYFPVGAELTSGQPDWKEGLYCGAELNAEHPLVQAGVPLHGPNLFPAEPAELRAVVLEYLEAMTQLGHRLMAGIALSLGLPEGYFAKRYTGDPLVLFRIFNYPGQADASGWGVGEHTDYGLLTILKQDDAGGLQVKVRGSWIDAPPVADAFICNLGDMLDRLTGGLYRSTPHRVRNVSGHDRLSFPFFFDPNFNARIAPIDLSHAVVDDHNERWDKASVHDFHGTYGDYLLNKVAKVFPQLRSEVLAEGETKAIIH
jgi:isopenicillin N synthase-like dioxygenase